jgi:hypothetical protein
VCVHAKMWIVCSELAFAADTVSAAANYHSLPKLSRLHRISIGCRIMCSAAKLWFAAETVSAAAN